MLTAPVSSRSKPSRLAKSPRGWWRGDKVVNRSWFAPRQVMLKVNVSGSPARHRQADGRRSLRSMNYGTAVVNFNNSNPLTAFGRPLVSDNGLTPRAFSRGCPRSPRPCGRWRVPAWMKTRPSRTDAISGESATFIPAAKPGPRRLFLRSGHPCLYNPDLLQEIRHFAQLHAGRSDRSRISLRVMTEVPNCPTDNAITLNQAAIRSLFLDQGPAVPRRR